MKDLGLHSESVAMRVLLPVLAATSDREGGEDLRGICQGISRLYHF